MKELTFNNERFNKLSQNKKLTPLALAFLEYAKTTYSYKPARALADLLTDILGKPLWQLTTVEEFLTPEVRDALTSLTDADYTQTIAEILQLRMGYQFSTSAVRRAFRSRRYGYYAAGNLRHIVYLIRLYYYEATALEFLQAPDFYVSHMDYLIALEIRRGNQEVREIIKDMILGDNNTLLSRGVILGIIYSEDAELLDLLMDLLLAAKNQEGLRQAILESADAGSYETFLKIFKVCMDHDLFRFTSAARSLFTWTGIGVDTLEIPKTRKLAETAWKCLTDDACRQEMLESANAYDAYLAIWSMGCKDVDTTDAYVETLLTEPKKYRRILGWFFITNVEEEDYRHRLAIRHLDEPEDEVLAVLTQCLYFNSTVTWYSTYRAQQYEVIPRPDPHLPASYQERLEQFNRLRPLVEKIGNRKKQFTGSPFPWSVSRLNNETSKAAKSMLTLAAYDLDPAMIHGLSQLVNYMCVDDRQAFYGNLLDPKMHPNQKEYLYQALKDKSIATKELAIRKLSACTCTETDIDWICALLTSKSASLKKIAMSYLKDRDSASRQQAIDILAGGNDAQLQASMELLLQDEKLKSANEGLIRSLQEKTLSSQAHLLLNQLIGEDTTSDELSPENGYGLYTATAIDKYVEELSTDESIAFSDETPLKKLLKKPAMGNLYMTKKAIQQIFPGKDEVSALYAGINQIFEDHKDYEYNTIQYDGRREKVLFGNFSFHIPIPEEYHKKLEEEGKQAELYMLPFAEEFRQAFKPYISDPKRMLGLALISTMTTYYNKEEYSDPWLTDLRESCLACHIQKFQSLYKDRIYAYPDLIRMAILECDQTQLFDQACSFYFSMLHLLGKGYISFLQEAPENAFPQSRRSEDRLISSAASIIRLIKDQITLPDPQFRIWFLNEYRLRRPIRFLHSNLLLEDFFRAMDQKIIPEEAWFEWILHPDRRENWEIRQISSLRTGSGQRLSREYPWLPPLAERLIDHMVRFEMRRGQAETPISDKVQKIQCITGAEYFNLLLRGLGKDNFFRGYIWSGSSTKQCVLSCLLRHCQPAPDDTAETLRQLLKGSDIKEKRLVEAAMYASQWAPIIEEYIGWPGLKKGVWFFQAHCSEHFSSDKETEVAIYSPISAQEFNDGAFDIEWFRSAYEELGEKRFQTLYKAAKYITDGSNAHRRSQLYTDAVTGKFRVEALEEEIKEKRNQEKLRAYALIPLDGHAADGDPSALRTADTAAYDQTVADKEAETKDLLRRYTFITRFQKESRQFGAQKRESEKKACATALANLAITCGIGDVDRMLWRLESAKNAELAPLLTQTAIGDYTAVLQIDEEGLASVAISKDDKQLKTLPKALAKNEYVAQLKQAVKDLKEQRSRSKRTLEQAMINKTVFAKEELDNILASPVIAPMVRKLLWINEKGEIDFLPQITGEGLRIAHCHDLAASGHWEDYIHAAFSQKLIQPFKQIFREYYPLSDEEREEGILSRRYAGYQVQPKKTMGLLKGCGWTVDYEEGLQKVCYSADLVVRMYSYADWFSPSDIESPTLEEIRFFSRRTWKPVPLEEIDPILFSEVMRDFDLVVSAAYVGGVDPETSHSTVEMRASIAKELTSLLKLENVTFLERHARISGKLAEYSVHLGSGTVHATGIGMIPILPVHSQHRGRIFLPFADEDPKTAEIMSKIILLAEDGKIKDPEILKYLR